MGRKTIGRRRRRRTTSMGRRVMSMEKIAILERRRTGKRMTTRATGRRWGGVKYWRGIGRGAG